MRNNKQSGFSHILIILIVVVLGVVGFAGYRVLKSKDTTKTSETTASTSTAPDSSSSDVPKGWKTVTESCSNLTFNVPEEWTTKDEQAPSFDEANCGAYSATAKDGNVLSWTAAYYGDGASNCDDYENTSNCPSVEIIKLTKMPSTAGIFKDLYVAKTRSCYPSTDSCAGFVLMFEAKYGITPKVGDKYKIPQNETDFQPSLVSTVNKELLKAGKSRSEEATAGKSYVALSMSQYKSIEVAGNAELLPKVRATADGVTAYTKAQTDAWLASQAADDAYTAIQSAKIN